MLVSQVPAAGGDQPSGGGKGEKKGGKKGAEKRAAAAEQSATPLETPWRCKAGLNLSALIARAGVSAGGDDDEGRRKSSVLKPRPAMPVDCGDSPLRIECSAKLTLKLPVRNGATAKSGDGGGEPSGDRPKTAEAPVAAVVDVSDLCTCRFRNGKVRTAVSSRMEIIYHTTDGYDLCGSDPRNWYSYQAKG